MKPAELENEAPLVSSRWLKQAVMEQSISFFLKSIQAWSEALLKNILKAPKQTWLQLKPSAKIQVTALVTALNLIAWEVQQVKLDKQLVLPGLESWIIWR